MMLFPFEISDLWQFCNLKERTSNQSNQSIHRESLCLKFSARSQKLPPPLEIATIPINMKFFAHPKFSYENLGFFLGTQKNCIQKYSTIHE